MEELYAIECKRQGGGGYWISSLHKTVKGAVNKLLEKMDNNITQEDIDKFIFGKTITLNYMGLMYYKLTVYKVEE